MNLQMAKQQEEIINILDRLRTKLNQGPDNLKILNPALKAALFASLQYKMNGELRTTAKTITSALKAIASHLGLELYSADESSAVTICGSLFVIDIDMLPDGSILRVTLAASDINELDEVERYLTVEGPRLSNRIIAEPPNAEI